MDGIRYLSMGKGDLVLCYECEHDYRNSRFAPKFPLLAGNPGLLSFGGVPETTVQLKIIHMPVCHSRGWNSVNRQWALYFV